MNMEPIERAAPQATRTSERSGTMACSSVRPRRSLKTRTRVGLNVNGPPSNMTGGLISMPCARPPMVCLAMA